MIDARHAPRSSAGVLLLAVLVSGAGPAEAVSVAIAPPYVEKLARPGHELQDTIAYTNTGSEPVMVSIEAVDFDVTETDDVIEQPAGTRPTSLAPYLRISPVEIRVPPGQQVFFRYVMRAPGEFRHLRGMLYFLARPLLGSPATSRVLFAARTGVPLYLESTAARPARIRVVSKAWDRREQDAEVVDLALVLTNEGERMLRPAGFAEVRSADGTFRKTFAFNESKRPVFPGSTLRMEVAIGPVPRGALSVTLRLQDSMRSTLVSEERIPAAGG